MNQSDGAELALVFIMLLVTATFGPAMGIGDHLDADRFVAALTPDLGVPFGADVVAGVVLVAFFGGLAVGAKLLLDS